MANQPTPLSAIPWDLSSLFACHCFPICAEHRPVGGSKHEVKHQRSLVGLASGRWRTPQRGIDCPRLRVFHVNFGGIVAHRGVVYSPIVGNDLPRSVRRERVMLDEQSRGSIPSRLASEARLPLLAAIAGPRHPQEKVRIPSGMVRLRQRRKRQLE